MTPSKSSWGTNQSCVSSNKLAKPQPHQGTWPCNGPKRFLCASNNADHVSTAPGMDYITSEVRSLATPPLPYAPSPACSASLLSTLDRPGDPYVAGQMNTTLPSGAERRVHFNLPGRSTIEQRAAALRQQTFKKPFEREIGEPEILRRLDCVKYVLNGDSGSLSHYLA